MDTNFLYVLQFALTVCGFVGHKVAAVIAVICVMYALSGIIL